MLVELDEFDLVLIGLALITYATSKGKLAKQADKLSERIVNLLESEESK